MSNDYDNVLGPGDPEPEDLSSGQEPEQVDSVEELVDDKPKSKKSTKKPSKKENKKETSGTKMVLNASDLNLYIEISRSEGYFIGSRQKVEVAEEHLSHPKFQAYAKQLRVL